MVKINITCYLKGDELSSEDIKNKTGVIFHSIKEYKKAKVDLQIKTFKKVATLIPEENNICEEDEYTAIRKFSAFLRNKVKIFKKYGCEKIILLLTIQYIDQCNLEFSSSELRTIEKTFDDLYITCYEVEEF
jgi:hypothetical protein